MNILRRFRIHVARTPANRFTLQELADFVELCARRDMDPSTPIRFMVDGQEVKAFEMAAEGGDQDGREGQAGQRPALPELPRQWHDPA